VRYYILMVLDAMSMDAPKHGKIKNIVAPGVDQTSHQKINGKYYALRIALKHTDNTYLTNLSGPDI
jgi:hypothetical protein